MNNLIKSLEGISELSNDTPLVNLVGDNKSQVDRDIEEAEIDERTDKERAYLEEAHNAVNALESYLKLLYTSQEKGGISVEAAQYFAVGYTNIISKFPHIRSISKESLESLQEGETPYVLTCESIREIEYALEGILGEISDGLGKIWGNFKKVFDIRRDSIADLKLRVKQLNNKHIPTGSTAKIDLPTAWKFSIDGKFNPVKALDNFRSLYEEEIGQNRWCQPINNSLKAVREVANKLKSDSKIKDPLKELKTTLEEAVRNSYNEKLWKKSSGKTPTLTYHISDNVKVSKPLPDFNSSLVYGKYSYEEDDQADFKLVVPIAQPSLFDEFDKLLDNLYNQYGEIETNLDRTRKNLEDLISEVEKELKVSEKDTNSLTNVLWISAGLLVIFGGVLATGALTHGVTKGALIATKAASGSVNGLAIRIGGALLGATVGGSIADVGSNMVKDGLDTEKRRTLDKGVKNDSSPEDRVKLVEELEKKSKTIFTQNEKSLADLTKSVLESVVDPYRKFLADLLGYIEISFVTNDEKLRSLDNKKKKEE